MSRTYILITKKHINMSNKQTNSHLNTQYVYTVCKRNKTKQKTQLRAKTQTHINLNHDYVSIT